MHVQISKTSKFLARSTRRELTNFVFTVGCKYVPRLLSTGRHKDQVNYMSKFGKWRNFVSGRLPDQEKFILRIAFCTNYPLMRRSTSVLNFEAIFCAELAFTKRNYWSCRIESIIFLTDQWCRNYFAKNTNLFEFISYGPLCRQFEQFATKTTRSSIFSHHNGIASNSNYSFS